MERRELTLSRICYVDETITDRIKVTYIALVAKVKVEDNFKTFDNIDKFIKNNLHKINDSDIRKKASWFWKSQHVRIIDPKFQEVKKLIVNSEFHEKILKKFFSSKYETELENRKDGLKNLISKIDCNIFYIDNYANRKFKNEIQLYGKEKRFNYMVKKLVKLYYLQNQNLQKE